MTRRRIGESAARLLVTWKGLLASVIVLGIATAYGCSADGPSESRQPGARPSNSLSAVGQGRSQFAPRGVPLPDTGIFTLIPEPYRRGEPAPQMTDLPNLADSGKVPGRRLPPPAPPVQGAGSNDSWRSWNLPGVLRGIYAGFDVMEDPLILPPQTVPRGWLIYAPTALPHGPGCFEVTNYHGEDPPGSGLGVWNWCNGSSTWYYMTAINTTNFRNNFVRSYVDPFYGTTRKRYFIQVYGEHPAGADQSTDKWWALLYNYSTGQWVSLGFPMTGAALAIGPTGWLMHESRNLADRFDGATTGVCYQIRSTAASEVLFMNSDGTWNPPSYYSIPSQIDSTYIVGGAVDCFNYNSTNKPWNFFPAWSWGWIAKTPSVNP